MDRLVFIDQVFDVLNESDDLELKDIITDGKEESIRVIMGDGSKFKIEITEME